MHNVHSENYGTKLRFKIIKKCLKVCNDVFTKAWDSGNV